MLGRKTSMQDPDMGSWSYSYDANGNLISTTDANSKTMRYNYDQLNRLTSKTDTNGAVSQYLWDGCTADANGNLTGCNTDYRSGWLWGTIAADGYTWLATFDQRGRKTEDMWIAPNVLGYSTTYAYNAMDQVTQTSYLEGETVQNS